MHNEMGVLDSDHVPICGNRKQEERISNFKHIKFLISHITGKCIAELVTTGKEYELIRAFGDEAKITPYVNKLEELSRNYLELEQMVETPLIHRYPPEYNITGLRTEQAAESVAIEERLRLGLGDGPVPVLRDILEQDVGLRIFYLPLRPSKFSAIYHYDNQLGGNIAINRLHSEERRRWSLAHEYAHFLAHRYKPAVLVEDAYQRLPESERFADAFARYFLMPTSSLIRRFQDVRRTKQSITPVANHKLYGWWKRYNEPPSKD